MPTDSKCNDELDNSYIISKSSGSVFAAYATAWICTGQSAGTCSPAEVPKRPELDDETMK